MLLFLLKNGMVSPTCHLAVTLVASVILFFPSRVSGRCRYGIQAFPFVSVSFQAGSIRPWGLNPACPLRNAWIMAGWPK